MCVVADASLSARRKIAQIQGVHAADADHMHTDRDLRPLLVEPPRSLSLTPPRMSREELQTTNYTPLRLMIDLGGQDGRDFSHDTWCLNIHNATPSRTKPLIIWEPPAKIPRHAPCRRPMPPRVRCFTLHLASAVHALVSTQFTSTCLTSG
ncbi:hypothetical protein B0H14DRAFT_1351564 [Mycena olivaceomarginata]|nr:hypothetical protein B0H14DRAFT_1351564 [Mycena olivaceomarginata]